MTAPTIPTSAAELEEMLGDDAQLKKVYENGGLGQFIANYSAAARSSDPGIETQIEEGAQRVLAKMIRDNGAEGLVKPDLSPLDKPKARGKHYNAKAAGAALDGKFECFGEIFTDLYAERKGSHAAAQKLAEIRNAFSTTTPSEGGFLVPEEFRAELLRVALERSIIRSRARVVPMAVPRVKFPTLDSTTNAGSVHGGVIGYWTEEGAALQASSPTFGSIVLDVSKLTAYAEIPNELLKDSAISVEPLVNQMFPEALGFFSDLAMIEGGGVGKPLGFLKAPSAVTVAKEGSQAADTLLWENIVKMYARMLPTSLGNAVWIMNNDVLPQLLQMTIKVKNAAGTENVGGSAVGIAYGDGAATPTLTLLGRPIVLTEKVPTLGDLGDVNFVDLDYYLVGDLMQMTAMTSEHFKFNMDTTAYRVIERLDGRPWLQSAITPAKGANTLSPFVKLEAR